MLNIQFYYIHVFFLPFLVFVASTCLLVVNYLFHIKNFLFFKLKNKIKLIAHQESFSVSSNTLSMLLLYISVLFLYFKFNISITVQHYNFIIYKSNFFIFIFLSLLLLAINLVFKYFFNDNYVINYNAYIGVFFTVLLFFILNTTNLLIFFFVIELFSYLFYFQFLQVFNNVKTKKKINFYLDSLLLYYWVNFFGSIILLYSIIYIFFKFNTTDFFNLVYFFKYSELHCALFFFLLGFSLKMGVPGLHFFKVEIYKNLKIDSIINFSFFSLFGYVVMLNYLISTTFVFVNFSYFFIFLSTAIFILLVPINLKITNIVLFFGYSTILNTLLCLFLIF